MKKLTVPSLRFVLHAAQQVRFRRLQFAVGLQLKIEGFATRVGSGVLCVGYATWCPALAMNSALDKLYNDLINEADQEPPEEITDAERAKRFLAEKQVTISKLKEVKRGFGNNRHLWAWIFSESLLCPLLL